MFAKAVLWLFLLNLGVVVGAGLYEARISTPRWVSNGVWHGDEAKRDDVGRRFWGFTTTVPLTLLVLLNLWAAYGAAGDVRNWWLAAAGVALAERLFTFGYFIPTMVRLMALPAGELANRTATQWATLNGARLMLCVIAYVLAMKTVTVQH